MDRSSNVAASFERLGPAAPATPVVLSVPHAGRDYPRALLAASRLGTSALRRLEDRLVDALVEPLAARGHAVIVARRARAWIDLNRSELELDPAMIAPPPASDALVRTAKVRGGLGLIPRRLIGAGEIYVGPIAAEDLHLRIADTHRPFHAALAEALAAARRRFGIAVLLDCHSMPPLGASRRGVPPATIVIGDRDGRSAAGWLAMAASEAFGRHGCLVARNAPYAGGHIVARHGRPSRGVHALQIELCRSLYLDTAHDRPGPGFEAASAMLDTVAAALAEETLMGLAALAAE